MIDAEIVLRFFAFRDREFVKGSVRSILDEAMKRHRNISQATYGEFRKSFRRSLRTALKVFGEDAFKIEGSDGKKRLSRPLFDAVMVAFDKHLDHRDQVIAKAKPIRESILGFTQPDHEKYPLLVGRANTADAIKSRIDLISKVVAKAIK
ncbi:hypothetical protein [Erythrobacter aureus]|uniref:hypothetical protein n=1 Tax=Erythrobacter aureus TaxID=2182384 RepID=UPI003A944B6C